jgi:hypothetical protein
MSPQFRSGGDGGMHTVGYDGSQFPAGGCVGGSITTGPSGIIRRKTNGRAHRPLRTLRNGREPPGHQGAWVLPGAQRHLVERINPRSPKVPLSWAYESLALVFRRIALGGPRSARISQDRSTAHQGCRDRQAHQSPLGAAQLHHRCPRRRCPTPRRARSCVARRPQDDDALRPRARITRPTPHLHRLHLRRRGKPLNNMGVVGDHLDPQPHRPTTAGS